MPATYEPIATTTLGTASTTITFSSIPATYTDLKLILVVNGSSGGSFSPQLRFNGSSGGTEYSDLFINTDGTTGSSASNGSSAKIALAAGGSISSTIPSFFEVDIFSYASSSVFKSVLGSYSNDRSGSGFSARKAAVRRNVAAITSLELNTDAVGSFAIGTTATLYGIKAA
jgi:hypothetical protein